ncbi:MAG: hypothetical protein FWE22_00365 [Firmicutes bacterium]|nr:hypothetical protein [Bacillota bacterium]
MKKISKILSLIVGLLFAAGIFVGCMGFPRVPNLTMEQDTNFVVRSQGGSAVQYGNIVYFINGFNTLTYNPTADGRFNAWGDVQRGALYRAELRGEREGREFVSGFNENPDLVINENAFTATGQVYAQNEFYSTPQLRHGININDEDFDFDNFDVNDPDNWIDLVAVERIVPKAIGTVAGDTLSGHGGIFIFGEWIYYATPSITRDTAGRMQDDRVDFMRTRVDGSQTQHIYSTQGPANHAPYAFYRIGDAVYMVVFYTPAGETSGRIVSVRMEDNRRRPNNPYLIAENVTSVIFPRFDFYDSVNHYRYENNLEHFIFFTRNFVHGDGVQEGNIVEMMRPSGEEGIRIRGSGQHITLVDVRDGLLIYTETDLFNNQIIKYDNLHDALMGGYAIIDEESVFVGSRTYREHQLSLTGVNEYRQNIQINSYYHLAINANLFGSSYIFFRDHHRSHPMILASSAQGPVQLVSALNVHNVLNEVWPVGVTKHHLYGSELYFLGDGNYLMRIDILTPNATPQVMSHAPIEQNHFAPDLVAGFVMYFAFVDEWVMGGGYAFFRSTRRDGDGVQSVLVYYRAYGDRMPEEDEDFVPDDDLYLGEEWN